jgi:hypothetical protein
MSEPEEAKMVLTANPDHQLGHKHN